MGSRGAKSSLQKTYEMPKEMIDNVKQRYNGNYYIATISPDDFLKITTGDKQIKDIEKDTIKNYGDLDLNQLNKSYMSLTIDLNSGRVRSHQGRHRMVLLRNAGYKQAQIVVQSLNSYYYEDDNPNKNFKHDIGALHLTHQIEKEKYKVTLSKVKFIKGD